MKYYIINPNPDSGEVNFIADSTHDLRWAHKQARLLTRESGEIHIVCKPVVEYSCEIKKKRIKQ